MKGIIGGMTSAAVAAGFAAWQVFRPSVVGSVQGWESVHAGRDAHVAVNCDAPSGNDQELPFLDVLVLCRVVVNSNGVAQSGDVVYTPAEMTEAVVDNLNALYSFNEQQFSPTGQSRIRFSPYLLAVTEGTPGLVLTWDQTQLQYVCDRSLESGANGRDGHFTPATFSRTSPAWNFVVSGIYGGAVGGAYGATMSYSNISNIGIASHEFGHIALNHTWVNTNPTTPCSPSFAQYCDIPADPDLLAWSQSNQDNARTAINKNPSTNHFTWNWSQLGYTSSTVVKGYTVAQWGQVQFTNVMGYYTSTLRHLSLEQLIRLHTQVPSQHPNKMPASVQLYDTLRGGDVLLEKIGAETKVSWSKVSKDNMGHLGFVDSYVIVVSQNYANPSGITSAAGDWDMESFSVNLDGDLTASLVEVIPLDVTEGWSYQYDGQWWDYTGEPAPDYSLMGTWSSEWDDPETRGGCGWAP